MSQLFDMVDVKLSAITLPPIQSVSDKSFNLTRVTIARYNLCVSAITLSTTH